jgi:hypothetical protein
MYFLTPTKNTENKSKIADSKVVNKSEKSFKQTLPVMTKNGDDLQKLRLLEKEKTSLNKKDNASLIRISNNNQVSQNINKLDQELNKMSLLQPKILTKYNTKTVIGKQGIEVYMIDYKTLDYRAYRKKSTKPIDPLSLANATPANSAEKNQIYSENQEADLWQRLPEQIHFSNPESSITCKIGVLPTAAVKIINQVHIGLIHISSGLGLVRLENKDQILPLRNLCAANSGFLSILSAPVELKERFDVWGYNGNALAVMRGIKTQFDGNFILSPGRFVGGI